MTIAQIFAVLLAGPVATITFLRMIVTIIHRGSTFTLVHAFAFCVAVTALVVAFFGVC